MVSSYTPNKGFDKPANGDYVDTWNIPVNSDWDIADRAFGGTYGVSLTNSNVTLTQTNCQNVRIRFTGNISANITVFFPAGVSGFFIVTNLTTGAFTVTLASAGGAPGTVVATEQGRSAFVFTDGSNVIYADDSRISLIAGTGISITGTTSQTVSLIVPVAAENGGTGNTGYVIGDILYASASNALSRLADVATGNALISGGVGVVPSWGKIGLTTHVTGTLPATNGGTGIASYTTGDILYASSGTALSALPDVATGNALISGGIGVAPAWGKIGMSTHVTGTLPVANGGTGVTTSTGTGSVVLSDTPTFTGVPAVPTAAPGTNSTQIANTSFVSAAIASVIAGAIPVGVIAMWSGSAASIPSGWALCNGLNGTPDLRDRFVVGAGSSYAVGATGGANTITLSASEIPSHAHAQNGTFTTTSAGTHTHSINDAGHFHTVFNVAVNGAGSYSFTLGGGVGLTNVYTSAATTGITINDAGAHTHSVTISGSTGAAGGGGAHENRPPYYALCYIMRV